MVKFKYLKHMHYQFIMEDILDDGYPEVPCPLPDIKRPLPDGEYVIRDNKKGHRKVYCLIEGRWFLTETLTKLGDGYMSVQSLNYMLFPMLPHKEYVNMRQVGYHRLTKFWGMSMMTYFHWLEIREMQKDIRKLRFKF